MQKSPEQIPVPEGEETLEPENARSGFSDADTSGRNEPLTGETNERDPAWRPGEQAPGDGVYENAQETGVEDEPKGSGI